MHRNWTAFSYVLIMLRDFIWTHEADLREPKKDLIEALIDQWSFVLTANVKHNNADLVSLLKLGVT